MSFLSTLAPGFPAGVPPYAPQVDGGSGGGVGGGIAEVPAANAAGFAFGTITITGATSGDVLNAGIANIFSSYTITGGDTNTTSATKLAAAINALGAVAATATVTVGGTITSGDVIQTTVNGNLVSYTVVSGDTSFTTLATHIASGLNADGTVGAIISAAGQSESVTETYTPTSNTNLTGGSAAVAATGSLTLGGTPSTGDVVTVTIASGVTVVPVPYTVTSSDTTLTLIATHLASAINANTGAAALVSAVGSSANVNLTAATAGAAGNNITVACSVNTLATETVVPTVATNFTGGVNATAAHGSLTLGGTMTPGDTFITTVISGSTNVAVRFPVLPGDTTAVVAQRIAQAVNANSTLSPIITATSGNTTVTITANATGTAGNSITIAGSLAVRGVVKLTQLTLGTAGNATTLATGVSAGSTEAYFNSGPKFTGGTSTLAPLAVATSSTNVVTITASNLGAGGYLPLAASVTGSGGTSVTVSGTVLDFGKQIFIPNQTFSWATIDGPWTFYAGIPVNVTPNLKTTLIAAGLGI